MSWLQDQDDELVEEFPGDKGFKKRTITRYLLEDTTDDQIERLLDVIIYLFCVSIFLFLSLEGTIVVVIIWLLDLQLPVQSVPITTKVVSSNPVHGEVYLIQHYVIKFVSDLPQIGGFLLVLQFPPPIKLTCTI